jgi:acyl-CoA dehydrogenase
MDVEIEGSRDPFTLPQELQELQRVVRRIVTDELLPLEPEYLLSPAPAYGVDSVVNLRGVFAPPVVDRLIGISREAGLWDLHVPKELGGGGLGLLGQVVVDEQLMYCAVPLPIANVPNILYECNEEQRPRFLLPVIRGDKLTCFAQTEPNSGSDPGGMMQTTAVRDERGWVLNGTKMFISGAAQADIFMTQAVTDPARRQRGGITMFLVEKGTPGLTVGKGIPTWLGPTHGQHFVHFDDCRVPDANVLGEVGRGFMLGQRWLTIHDRLLRAPYALGKMRRALDLSVAWAKQRSTFGKPIAERQAIQWRLVDMYVDIQALSALAYQSAARADAGEDVRTEASLAKLCSGDWGARCLDHAIQIHGGMGETLELPLTLFYRLLRHAQVGGGTSEIHRMLIARSLLR